MRNNVNLPKLSLSMWELLFPSLRFSKEILLKFLTSLKFFILKVSPSKSTLPLNKSLSVIRLLSFWRNNIPLWMRLVIFMGSLQFHKNKGRNFSTLPYWILRNHLWRRRRKRKKRPSLHSFPWTSISIISSKQLLWRKTRTFPSTSTVFWRRTWQNSKERSTSRTTNLSTTNSDRPSRIQ